MKKSLSWAKQEKLRLRREQETRQEVHQITELVEPPVPPSARWQVFEWCVRIGNWQHVGYASTESSRRSLADGVRALGGKVRVDELTPQRPTTPSRGGRNIVVVRAPSAPSSAASLSRTSPQPAAGPDFRKSLLSSLSVWISEVWKAKVDAELPVDQIRAVRDACKTAVQKRKGRSFRPSQPDPFAKFE